MTLQAMQIVTMDEAKDRLERLSEQVRSTGASIGLTVNGRVIVVLRPFDEGLPPAFTGRELAAGWENGPRMSSEDAEAFARDVAEAIKAGNDRESLFDPWAS